MTTTARLTDHIENLRTKPEHIRRRIALGASSGITGIVVVLWAVALATSGSFTLQSDTVASDATAPNIKTAFSQTGSGLTSMLGAAGAAFGATTTAPANLNIVETRASSTLDAAASSASATVIPF